MPTRDNSKNPMTITAPTGGITAGGFKLIGGVLYWCPEAIAAAATGPGYWKDSIIRGAAKATGEAWVKGAKLYWDNTNFRFTTTVGSNTLRGFAAEAALSADATGDVEICQIPA